MEFDFKTKKVIDQRIFKSYHMMIGKQLFYNGANDSQGDTVKSPSVTSTKRCGFFSHLLIFILKDSTSKYKLVFKEKEKNSPTQKNTLNRITLTIGRNSKLVTS